MKDLATTDYILILEVNNACPEKKSSQLLEETIGAVWYPDTTPPQPNHNVTPTHIVPEQYNP